MPPHPRTRERRLALRDIARGTCASVLYKPLGRHVTILLKWVGSPPKSRGERVSLKQLDTFVYRNPSSGQEQRKSIKFTFFDARVKLVQRLLI